MSSRPSRGRSLQSLARTYREVGSQIVFRLNEFRRTWQAGEETELFSELVFCLLTPQSNALRCWEAVARLRSKGLILTGAAQSLARELSGVRFHNNKARYIVLARDLFMEEKGLRIRQRLEGFEDPFERREWMVQRVKGLGYKEASHFLRNVGLGEKFAILDRHILKRLRKLEVIDRLPTCISRRCYLDVERKMNRFSSAAGIPMDHLDLLLWYLETGIIFR